MPSYLAHSVAYRCLVCAVAWLQTAPSAATEVRQPVGYFVMQQVGGQNVKDAKLQSAAFAGIVIRERWATIAPTASTFAWKFLDGQVARAKKYGKQYILAIYTGNNSPAWLDVPLYMTAPLPWDRKMLTEHGKMVAELGARYGSDPLLVGVEIGGPTRGPSGSLEMHFANGWTRQEGYSLQKMIDAWSLCADQYAAAFPHCAVISDGGVAPGGGDPSITLALWDHLIKKYPEQANFSHCSLKANTSFRALHHRLVASVKARGGRIGFEMVGPSLGGANGENGPVARFGGPFTQALALANLAGAQWLKIYQADEAGAAASPFRDGRFDVPTSALR